MKQITEHLKAEMLEIEEARASFAGYKYAIVHMISERQYGTTENVKVNWEELVDLRAFSDKEELHVFERGGKLQAVRMVEDGEARETVTRRSPVGNGKQLVVKEYLAPDEDGQAVVVYTRPCGII